MSLFTAVFFSILSLTLASLNLEDENSKPFPEKRPHQPHPPIDMFNHPFMSPARMERVRQFIASLNTDVTTEPPYVNENSKPFAWKRSHQPHPPVIVNINGSLVKIDSPKCIDELNEKMSPYLYKGDLMLTDEQIDIMKAARAKKGTRQKRSAPVTWAQKWDSSKPIPYKLQSSLSEESRAAAMSAMEEIARKTCLSFAENPSSSYGLEFFSGQGCWSMIGQTFGQGKQPQWQQVSLGYGCGTTPLGVHEIMHALGSDHTQNRVDRDEYVTINPSNVPSAQHHNFEKLTEAENTNVVPYDYGSVMHYGAYDFAVDRNTPSLYPKDKLYIRTMGRQNRAVAFSDWKALCAIYNCSAACPTPVQCQNGGYVSPKDCSKCECPEYFSGTSCETVVNPINVESKKLLDYNRTQGDQTLINSKIEFDKFDKSEPAVVTGPKGSKLKVTFSGYSSSLHYCEKQCLFVGVEIVDGDLTTVGKTLCCKEDVGLNFVSKTNQVGVKFYSKPGFVASLNVTVEVV